MLNIGATRTALLGSRVGFATAIGTGFCVLAIAILLFVSFRKRQRQRVDSSHAGNPDHLEPRSPVPPGSDKENDDPVELAPAIRALERGQFRRVIRLAHRYVEDDREPVRADALRLMALAHSRLEEYADAYSFWLKLASIEPSSWNYLNMASTAAVIGRFEAAEKEFALCRRAYTLECGNDPDERITFHGRYQANFLSSLDKGGRPDLALGYLDELAIWYSEIHITDSMFLHMRTMPPLEVFLAQSLPIVRKVMDESALSEWYRRVYDAVDEDGKGMFASYRIPH